MKADLDTVRRLVVDDPRLRSRLLAVADQEAFVTEVVDVAREHEIELSPDDVLEGLREARRRRLQRWM